MQKVLHTLLMVATYTSNGDAKCGVDGTKTAVCDHGCGEEKTVADTGSALTHKFTNYKFNNDAAPGVDGHNQPVQRRPGEHLHLRIAVVRLVQQHAHIDH